MVISAKRLVVEVVGWVLVHRLSIGQIILRTVTANIVHVFVRIWGVILIFLAGVFKFANFESLLDENILDVIGQVVYLIFRLVIVVFALGLPKHLAL